MALAAQLTAPRLPANPKNTDWKYFKRTMTNYLTILDASEEQKLPIMLNCLGRDGLDIFDGLPEPKNTYEEAESRFDAHFGTRVSLLLRRKAFYTAHQEHKEPVTDYACRLRRLAADCEFASAQLNTLLRDIFVIGVKNDRIGERLLTEDSSTLTFESALARAEAAERAQGGRVILSGHDSSSTAQVAHVQKSVERKPASEVTKSKSCYRCGKPFSKEHVAKCPAKDAECRKCHRVGHFSSVCQAKGSSGSKLHSSNYMHSSITDEFNVFATSNSHADVTFPVSIDNSNFNVICDTGSELNIITNSDIDTNDLQSTNVTINAWGNFPLTVLGKKLCRVQYKDKIISNCTFYVVDVPAHGNHIKPLISATLSKELGLLRELAIEGKGRLEGEKGDNSHDTFLSNPHHCLMDSSDDPKIQTYLEKYRSVFDSNGLISTTPYNIELKSDVKPFAPPCRRVPPALLDKLKAEINHLVESGIIMRVDEASDWCSPTIIVYKKDGESLRIVHDFRELNKSIKRQTLQMPTLEEFRMQVSGAKIFSVLDCKGGFHQIPVSEESSKLLTFSVPFGRYRYLRLPQGVSSSPEIFQKVICSIIGDIPGVVCYIDDILLFSEDEHKHRVLLDTVLARLEKAGVRLNFQKCKFMKDNVSFLGHTWSGTGVLPSNDKLEAIEKIDIPRTGEQLHSFLGLATYVGNTNIPNFSNLTAPLWELPLKGPINFSDKTVHAFHKLKEALLNIQECVYFNASLPTVVQVDAGPEGIGGAIIQQGKPVIFVSRKLTPTEKKYSQIEREFLSIVFTLTRLKMYLMGLDNFVVETDHKPLLQIVNKPIDKLSNRLQRWLLSIQHFPYKLIHIKGVLNHVGDGLSRNPISKFSLTENEDIEHTVCFILKTAPVDMKLIANATYSDPELQLLLRAIEENFPNKYAKQLKQYYSFSEEITKKECQLNNDNSIVLLKGDRVIIPKSMQKIVLDQAHEGHLGSKKMKEILRTYTFWLGFSRDVEDYVKRCDSCIVYQRTGDKAPLKTVSDSATFPFEKIGIDLTGPSETTAGKVYFTLIDYYSRFPEAFILNNGSSSEVLNCLRSTFARYGIPICVVSDNGSVFHSKEITDFFAQLGIKHVYASNYYPIGNSTIERFHGTLKHRLKRILFDSELSHRAAVDKILFDIRSTPNSTTGETPFFRFFGRIMQTKFSKINPHRAPTASPHNVSHSYAKKRSHVVKYNIGDKIYYRKGIRDTFRHPGVITKICPNNAYEISNDRIYNQFHLKRRFKDNDSAWQNAYDAVVDSEKNAQNSGETSNFQNLGEGDESIMPLAPKKYNLRKRNVDPNIYRD